MVLSAVEGVFQNAPLAACSSFHSEKSSSSSSVSDKIEEAQKELKDPKASQKGTAFKTYYYSKRGWLLYEQY